MPERDVPQAKVVTRKRTRLSVVWIVPIVAAAVGVWVAVTRIMNQGPTITIVLDTAEGLEAGKTKVHYNGVEIGTVTTIALSDDHRRVVTHVEMDPGTEQYLVDDTDFWVVRPRISGASVTGLGTLISGAYIGMEIGTSKKSKRSFVALDTPPIVTGDVPGRFYVLKSADLGSLDYGTPVYFRRLKVGKIVSYKLDDDGQALTIKAFVESPYDAFVTQNTRFWHASGIDLSLTAAGLDVQTQSLMSILVGGVAFDAPTDALPAPPAESDAVFKLFDNRHDAFAPAARDPQIYRLVYRQSVRGLAAGAPVEFRGISIGEVVSLTPRFDAKTLDFSVAVVVRVDPQQLGVKVLEVAADTPEARHALVSAMVAHGFRCQLRSGNLLTGALYVACDFFPDAAAATVDWTQTPPEIPTVSGELEGLEQRLGNIVKKLDAVPIEAIGDDLRKAIVQLDRTLASARETLDHADQLVQPGSGLGQELGDTLQELTRAARGLRVLADYLEQHPEALLRGKKKGGH